MADELFVGEVMHARRVSPHYRFSYRVFSVLVEVGDAERARPRRRLFARNRFSLFSFHDADHLPPGFTGSLRDWIDGLLTANGIDLEGGRVRLLCFPRVLGFVFNPISVWYCEHRDGRIRAIVCEVRNTFGERHCYLLHAPDKGPMDLGGALFHAKRFHVSPFLPVTGDYEFRLAPPTDTLDVGITWSVDAERRVVTTQRMRRVAFTDAALLRLACLMPLMTLKVVAAIHWQALKLWLRGAQFHRKPQPPIEEISSESR